MQLASADSPEAVFVAIAPRVLDTRLDIGLRGPFVTEVAREFDVTGVVPVVAAGDEATTGAPVPDGATTIVANIPRSRRPTSATSVRAPAGRRTPTTSSIDIGNPGGVWPDSVAVELAGNGRVNLWYLGPTSVAPLLRASELTRAPGARPLAAGRRRR